MWIYLQNSDVGGRVVERGCRVWSFKDIYFLGWKREVSIVGD